MEIPSNPKLLVVDDDRKLAGLIRDYLTPMGYEVELRHNGPDGLVEALATPYEAVILDVMMPGMDSPRCASCASWRAILQASANRACSGTR